VPAFLPLSSFPAFLYIYTVYNGILDKPFGFCFLCYNVNACTGWVLSKVTAVGERAKSPLYHLLRKLVLYPIVQCVTRLGTTPYDIAYHATFAAYPENGNAFQTFLAYLEVIFAPAAGLGALLVFLIMQKGAKTQLWRMLKLDFTVAEAVTSETVTVNPQHPHNSKTGSGSRRGSSAQGRRGHKVGEGNACPPGSNGRPSAKSGLSTMVGQGSEGRGGSEYNENGDGDRFTDIITTAASGKVTSLPDASEPSKNVFSTSYNDNTADDGDYVYEEEGGQNEDDRDENGAWEADEFDDTENGMDFSQRQNTLKDMTESELVEKYISDTYRASTIDISSQGVVGIKNPSSTHSLQLL
jgi:hypothetical protein